MRLFVACSNEPAITLYKKFGMAVINTVTNYYGKGSHAHTMQFTVRDHISFLLSLVCRIMEMRVNSYFKNMGR